MIVNEQNLPHLYQVFRILDVQADVGITPLTEYKVLDEHRSLCVDANAGLALLDQKEMEIFAKGGDFQDEYHEIANRTVNLKQADRALDEYINVWMDENHADDEDEPEDDDDGSDG